MSDLNEVIPVTIQLTPEEYYRLKMFGISKRKQAQDIFTEALRLYLDQQEEPKT